MFDVSCLQVERLMFEVSKLQVSRLLLLLKTTDAIAIAIAIARSVNLPYLPKAPI